MGKQMYIAAPRGSAQPMTMSVLHFATGTWTRRERSRGADRADEGIDLAVVCCQISGPVET